MTGIPDQGLASTEDQQMIRDAALQFLEERQPILELRSLRDGDEPSGVSSALWEEMAGLGWAGLLVPEPQGGAGLGFQELGVVFEALGRHLASSPLLSSSVLAASAISLVDGWGTPAAVAGIADGTARAALAFEESAHFAPERLETSVRREGDGFVLDGCKRPVIDGAAADVLLVIARIEGEDGAAGLFRVAPETEGVSRTLLRWLDGRRAAALRFEAVKLGGDAQVGTTRPFADLVEGIVDRGAAAVAAELVGIAAAAFALTVEYLKTREQFGHPLAEFQALQHRCARMYVDVERSISLVQDALRALDEGTVDSSMAASSAKAMTSELARTVTEDCLQLYGGLGMTEEQDIGLYFKRARVGSLLLGDAAYHYRRFARLNDF